MIEIQGKYNIAKVFTNNVEQGAISQIIELCNQDFVKDSQIRIMPDVHAGKGCTIGTTMTLNNKVVSNLVGVDIGCGMAVAEFDYEPTEENLKQLDKVINENIFAGFNVRNKKHEYCKNINLEELHCYKYLKNTNRLNLSLGTLGGGNHFIELNKSDDGKIYLVVHTGSRNLGKQVAEYYQDLAVSHFNKLDKDIKQIRIAETIKKLTEEGRVKEIGNELKKVKSEIKIPPKHLAYLEGHNFNEYLDDMKLTQMWANLNRSAIVETILKNLDIKVKRQFQTIHNYIDIDNMILRKGAVSAKEGEILIIPMNMRDGSLICSGKGNADWNYSAPHGAGRIMSRGKAKTNLTVEAFREAMTGVYTTSVGQSTLDEAPMAYKPIEEILSNIGDTVEVLDHIKPVYNFKAGGN